MSHSRASLTKLFVRMSKCLKQNKDGLDGIMYAVHIFAHMEFRIRA